MSRGINREAKEARYRRAVGRQQLLCDRGFYRDVVTTEDTFIFATLTPAPAVQFMRQADREADPRPDYRRAAVWAALDKSNRLS